MDRTMEDLGDGSARWGRRNDGDDHIKRIMRRITVGRFVLIGQFQFFKYPARPSLARRTPDRASIFEPRRVPLRGELSREAPVHLGRRAA
jgi:hypothetical protein